MTFGNRHGSSVPNLQLSSGPVTPYMQKISNWLSHWPRASDTTYSKRDYISWQHMQRLMQSAIGFVKQKLRISVKSCKLSFGCSASNWSEHCLQALIGDGLLLSLSASVVSDSISPANRAVALSLNLCGLAAAYTVGPVVSGALPTRLTLWMAVGGSLISVVLLLVFVPESTTDDCQGQGQLCSDEHENVPFHHWICPRSLAKFQSKRQMAAPCDCTRT